MAEDDEGEDVERAGPGSDGNCIFASAVVPSSPDSPCTAAALTGTRASGPL